MGLSNQFRAVIEWQNPSPEDLFYKWSTRGEEIKNASKLIVNPGQGAIFVYEGQVQAVHLESGLYELHTANIPFITTLIKFMQAFESEHKVGIYFVKLTEILDQKWGTRAPVKYLDPVYKFPVGLRAFGNFSYKITRPQEFFVNIAGIQDVLHVSDISRVITDKLLQPLTDLMAKSNFSYIEVDRNRDDLSDHLRANLQPVFEALGFALTDFRIESTDFDEETQARINRIADTIADTEAARSAGLSYAQMQQLQALRDAARNEGGIAGAGIGLGAGLNLGQAMAAGLSQTFTQNQTPNPGPAGNDPSSGDPSGSDPVEILAKLKKMLDENLITQDEYNAKKVDILNRM